MANTLRSRWGETGRKDRSGGQWREKVLADWDCTPIQLDFHFRYLIKWPNGQDVLSNPQL